jgi:hypothetical protein
MKNIGSHKTHNSVSGSDSMTQEPDYTGTGSVKIFWI